MSRKKYLDIYMITNIRYFKLNITCMHFFGPLIFVKQL